MKPQLSRRNFIYTTAALAASGRLLQAQQPLVPTLPPAGPTNRRSVVSIVNGESRRRNICESLVAFEDQILPMLRRKKHVIIKPNIVSTTNQLASTHVDALHGILDFLAPRFQGPS